MHTLIPKHSTTLFRVAHISDLHFYQLSCNPIQFFSKRWIGNFNSLLTRRKDFASHPLFSLIPLFRELKIDHLIISGDLTTTSLPKEFLEAKKFIEGCANAGISVYTLPGNHDHYTHGDFKKKVFYDFLPSSFDAEEKSSLKHDGVAFKSLGNKWWLIGLDTTLSTPWFSSYGAFSPRIEKKLEEILNKIPEDNHVIMTNHFPFFNNEKRKILDRAEVLKKMLQKTPQVKLFLHGHNHRQVLADLRANQLPIILDSGSTTHKEYGGWNMIDITDTGADIHVFNLTTSEENPWKKTTTQHFNWSSHE